MLDGGDLDIQRFAGRLEDFGQCAGGVERAAQAWIENRTIIDRDDGVAAGGGETDPQLAIAAAAGMNGDAPASGAVGVDQPIDLAVDAGMHKRIDHDLAFPRAIGLRLPVLNGAAAAAAEIFAERRDPFRAGALDPRQMPAVGMICHRFDLDGLAAKRIGHEHGLAAGKGNAVAAMTDMIDDETFNHGARR